MVICLVPTVEDANGRFDYGEVGSPVKNSRFFRDYCYMPGCHEPIRVSLDQLEFPNACSFCRPAYRGTPGVAEAERLFWIRESLEEIEVISGQEKS